MKVLIFLFLAGCASQIQANDWYTDAEDIGVFQAFVIDGLSSVFLRDCEKTTRENIKEKKEGAIQCIKNIRYNSSFCNTFVHHFKPCVQDLLEETKKCEKPEDLAMKNVILDSSIAEAELICGYDGEHILELLNPCVINSIKLSKECRRNVTDPINFEKDLSIVCSKFPAVQNCFEDQLQHECRHNDIAKTTLHEVLNVDVKPCNILMTLYFELGRHLSS